MEKLRQLFIEWVRETKSSNYVYGEHLLLDVGDLEEFVRWVGKKKLVPLINIFEQIINNIKSK